MIENKNQNNIEINQVFQNQNDQNEQKMSKNQKKRILRNEKYIERNKFKRQQEKEKKLKIKQNQPIQQEEPKNEGEKKRRFKDIYKENMQKAPILVIDCGFNDLMVEKESKSLVNQLTYCQNMNKQAEKPFLTGVDSKFKELLITRGGNGWGIQIEDKQFNELYDLDKFIYLTGDAQDQMDQLEEDKIYIIGGMVDHNRLKNASLDKATQLNIKRQKFPINQDTVSLKSSSILTVNTVYDIMLKKYKGDSWLDALQSAIPQRKIIKKQDS